jgi:hypothetical protein
MAGLRLLVVDEYGYQRTLANNVYVGTSQPTDEDVTIWMDTTTEPATIKYLEDGVYKSLQTSGVVNVTSVTNLPTNYKLIIAKISKDQELSIGDMDPGQEIQVIISGSGTITIPSDTEYINMTDDTITVSDYVEINIVSDGTKKYIRSIA